MDRKCKLTELTFQDTYVDSKDIFAYFFVHFRITANGATNLTCHEEYLFVRGRYVNLRTSANNLEQGKYQ